MKKFSLRHNYNTIELLGPLKHLKISIIYGHVNHNAVYSEAYWCVFRRISDSDPILVGQ